MLCQIINTLCKKQKLKIFLGVPVLYGTFCFGDFCPGWFDFINATKPVIVAFLLLWQALFILMSKAQKGWCLTMKKILISLMTAILLAVSVPLVGKLVFASMMEHQERMSRAVQFVKNDAYAKMLEAYTEGNQQKLDYYRYVYANADKYVIDNELTIIEAQMKQKGLIK